MRQQLEGIELGSVIRVVPWEDPVGELLGVDPRSAYVTRFWLPFLGPSTTLLLHVLAGRLDVSPEGCELEVAALAWALGLGELASRRGPFFRALGRAVDYRLALTSAPAQFAVRRRLPPLPERLAARLPRPLAEEHAALLAGDQPVALDALSPAGGDSSPSACWRSARASPRSSVSCCAGASHPPLARRCARWAASQPPYAENPTDRGTGEALTASATGAGR